MVASLAWYSDFKVYVYIFRGNSSVVFIFTSAIPVNSLRKNLLPGEKNLS